MLDYTKNSFKRVDPNYQSTSTGLSIKPIFFCYLKLEPKITSNITPRNICNASLDPVNSSLYSPMRSIYILSN